VIETIAIPTLLKRIQKFFQCNPSVHSTALALLDKFVEASHDQDTLNQWTAQQLITGVYTLAVKYIEDSHFSNKYYAEIGGMSVKSLNEMELTILKALEFSVYVSEDDFYRYENDTLGHLFNCRECGSRYRAWLGGGRVDSEDGQIVAAVQSTGTAEAGVASAAACSSPTTPVPTGSPAEPPSKPRKRCWAEVSGDFTPNR
jgi:hypothetical protein